MLHLACVGPRTPRAYAPFTVRLVGAADGGLRGTMRDGQSVFYGTAGRDYAVEVGNGTSKDIAIAVVVDGLDGRTGEPVASCGGRGWVLHPVP